MSELKPCPFCGGEAFIYRRGNSWGVKCTCDGNRFNHSYGKTEDEVIANWNTRTSHEVETENVEYVKVSEADPEVFKLVQNLKAIVEEIDESWASGPVKTINEAISKIKELFEIYLNQSATIQSQQEEIERLTSEFNRVGELLIKSGDKRMAAVDKIVTLQARVKELEGVLRDVTDYATGMINGLFDDPSRIDGIDCINRAKQALAGAEEVSPWQPIETAPKDGTKIIIYPVHKEHPKESVVFWKQPYTFHNDKGAWHHLGSVYNAPGYAIGQDQYTHWTPLPPAPEGE